MRFLLSTLAAACVVAVAPAALAADDSAVESPLFPFLVPYDAPENVTNVAAWLERPAGKHGFVRVEDGRLATDAGPLRIWGTNLCFSACFPLREEAERLAARLARLGLNGVRLHHMDARDIWGNSGNRVDIDPEQLDRLDYLIYQLKLHGIYVNINLHVSRQFTEREGFTGLEQRPKYDKGLDNFEPRMIALQKKFAKDLLTHVNPYTGTSYAEEPAVAMVEINNENGLMLGWANGDLDGLPEPYAGEYRARWNAWLAKKYGDTDTLRKAWDIGAAPLGDELLTEGQFQTGKIERPWNLQNDPDSDARMMLVDGGPDGGKMLRLVVHKQGRESWVPQLMYSGLSVEADKPYTLSFQMRADPPRAVNLLCRRAGPTYDAIGLSTKIDIGPEWKAFQFKFLATATENGTARLDFSALQPGTYELSGFSLRPGGIEGLAAGVSIEEGTVPTVQRGNLELTRPGINDFIDFLWDTEYVYWTEMRRYIREDLGVKAIVAGTQTTWSPTHVQAALDFCDAHAYWNHPVFPNRPWDSRDWYVRNLALVNHWSDGTLTRLAQQRVLGLPFTISEYNHPAPNTYAAEGFPMLAAFGRFQDWDGVFLFTYSHNREFEPKTVSSFFDIKADPTRLVHLPACAALFLRGDVTPAKQTIAVGLDREFERSILYDKKTPRALLFSSMGVDPLIALQHAVGVDLTGKSTSPAPEMDPEATTLASDTRQLFYDRGQPEGGVFAAVTPRTIVVTGFGARTYPLGPVVVQMGKTRLNWATLSMTSIEGESLTSPGRKLLAATGWMQNTGQVNEDLGSNRITVRNQWGTAPILCEGVAATVAMKVDPTRVVWYALDESGNRRTELPVETSAAGQAILKLAPEHKTLWYEIEIR